MVVTIHRELDYRNYDPKNEDFLEELKKLDKKYGPNVVTTFLAQNTDPGTLRNYLISQL